MFSSPTKIRGKKGPKHHYIPVFYLKQWAGEDCRLCEFSKPYDRVKPRRTHPDATGYERGLYTIPGVPDERSQILETIYMQNVDDWAARAIRILREPTANSFTLNQQTKVGWARFLYCMILRSPEYLERAQELMRPYMIDAVDSVRDQYEALREPGQPETFEEFRAQYLADPFLMSPNRILHSLIDSERIITHIMDMRWWTITINSPKHLLLTSDRPIIMTNGIGIPEGHIAMPISPRELFFATNSEAVHKQISEMPQKQLVQISNQRVTEQARKFVYGFSDAQLSFVSGRFGKMIPATPLETADLPRRLEAPK